MPVTFTSKHTYWEIRAKLAEDELELLSWLEKNDRPRGWTIREIAVAMNWESGRVSARLNALVFPIDQSEIRIVDRAFLKRYCERTGKLVFSHRAACGESPQMRFF